VSVSACMEVDGVGKSYNSNFESIHVSHEQHNFNGQ
jgi:hypothetical protein